MNKTGSREQEVRSRKKGAAYREQGAGRKGRKKSFVAHCSLLVTFLLILGSLCVVSAELTEEQIHKQADAIGAKLRCPVCQNLSVADSDSFMANQIKDKIKKMLKERKTEAEIMSYFKSKYGDWVFLAPPKRGFNIVVWILPFIGLAGGAVLIVFSLRSMKGKPAGAPSGGGSETAPGPVSDEVKRELENYDY